MGAESLRGHRRDVGSGRLARGHREVTESHREKDGRHSELPADSVRERNFLVGEGRHRDDY